MLIVLITFQQENQVTNFLKFAMNGYFNIRSNNVLCLNGQR